MLRIVADTNVLVSAVLFGGNPEKILELAERGQIRLFLSAFLLDELESVLTRKFRFSTGESRLARATIESMSVLVSPVTHTNRVSRKESDNRILDAALEAKADVLVTGDLRDLRILHDFCGIRILTPSEFLDTYSFS